MLREKKFYALVSSIMFCHLRVVRYLRDSEIDCLEKYIYTHEKWKLIKQSERFEFTEKYKTIT